MCNYPDKLHVTEPTLVAPEEELVSATNGEPSDLVTLNGKGTASNDKPFDKELFRKSFPLPEVKANKKKSVPTEKRSTVITSEAWKEVEKKKLEEKIRAEAEKIERKMEREKKKVLAAQVKAEKELIKERKRKEKAEKESEKKLKKGGSKKKGL